MFARSIVLLLVISAKVFAASPTIDEVMVAKGKEQLEILNIYMQQNAGVDAREALALVDKLKPTLPLQQFPKQKLTLFMWQGVALNFIGDKRGALVLLDTVINEAKGKNFTGVLIEALKHRSNVYLEQSNYDLALSDSFDLLTLVEHLGDVLKLAQAQESIGNIYYAMAKFSKSFEWLLKAQESFETVGDIKGEVMMLGRIGSIYRSIGDFDNALSYQLQSIEGQRTLGSEKGLAIAFNNTAIIYKDLGKYEDAIAMHTQSLELKQSIGYERGMVYSFNNLGETYRLSGDLETAKDYLSKAESLASKLNNRMLLGSTYLYLGRIAITEQRYNDAERTLNEAMAIYRKRNAASRIAEGLLELANLAVVLNRFEQAIPKLEESIDYAKQSQKNVVLFKAYDLLSQAYANIGDFKAAFEMQRTYQASRDALFDLNSQQRIEMLVVKNQIAETRKNLELLRQQSKLTESELNHAIANRNLMILGVLSFVVFLWYLHSRRVHKRELKLVEQSRTEIAEKEQKLSLALWASGDVLWSWDLNSHTISRENADDLSALPDGEVDPSWQNLKAHVHKEDFHKLVEHLEAIKSCHEDSFSVSYRVKNKAGEWAWVQDKGKVVKEDEFGNPLRVAGIQHDITILKQQEADLVVLNTELEERVKKRTHDLLEALENLKATQQNLVEAEKMAALGSLVAGLAHELNTPLGTAMMAVTHLHAEIQQLNAKIRNNELTKSDLSAGLKILAESGDLIFNGVNRTSTLVEQFKRVSVSEIGEGRVNHDFSAIVNAAFKAASLSTGEPKNINLINDCSGQICSYTDPLMQVLELLISNAVYHAEASDSLVIKISLMDQNAFYEISVEDNGVGIAEPELSKIFNPFYTMARHKGHAGLGLNIAYNLVVQVLGGEIFCERSELGGAKFRFTVEKVHEEVLV